MPLNKKQINRLLDPELIRPQDMPHTVGRAAESAVKRGVFAVEDRAVQELAGLYRALRQDIRNDGYTLAERLGIERLEMNRAGQQWRQAVTDSAVRRVRGMVTPVASNALKHATTAWMGGYFGRAWMLDVMTTPDAPIVVRRHDKQDVARYLAGLVGIREDEYTDTINNLLGNEWRQLFANELGELEIKIKRAIWTGMEAGEGIPDIMQRVEDVLGSYSKQGYTANFNRVQVMTRTVVNQASNNGAIQVYREHRNVVSEYEILSARDERVCPTCRGYNGERHPLDDYFRPPFHANCRCTIIPVISDMYLMPGDGYYSVPSLREWATDLGLTMWLTDFYGGLSKDSDRWGDDAYTDFY